MILLDRYKANQVLRGTIKNLLSLRPYLHTITSDKERICQTQRY